MTFTLNVRSKDGTWLKRGAWSGAAAAGLPGVMRNVVGSVPAGTSYTARVSDDLPSSGAGATAVRRTRNDPNGNLGGAFSVDDPATSRSRDFTNLTPGTYTLTSAAVNGSVTPPAVGPVTSVTVTVVAPEGPVVSGTRTTSASPVRRAQDVCDIMGVTAHLPRPQYDPFSSLVAALDALGVKRLRTGFGTYNASSTRLAQIRDLIINQFRPRGIKLCLVIDMDDWTGGSGATTDAQIATVAGQIVQFFKDSGYVQDILFIEGDNEPGGFSAEAAGVELARRRTAAVHAAFKNDPMTAHILRGSPSMADTNSDSAYQKLAANGGLPDCQVFTSHDYPGVDYQMSGPSSYSDLGYAITNTIGRTGRFVIPTPSGTPLPFIVTETGWSDATRDDLGKCMPRAAAAGQEIRIWLEHARGIGGGTRAVDCLLSCHYELRDENSSIDYHENRFGFFDSNWQAKNPVASAIANLMRLLVDTGSTSSTFTPTTLGQGLSGTDNDTRSLLMQKSDGSWWLALWQEWQTWNGSTILNPAPRTVTLSLPSARTVTTYPAASGPDAPTVRGTGTSFALACGADPLIVRIV